MREVVICETADDVADAAADIIHRIQAKAIRKRGLFGIALSGDGVSELLYEELASEEWLNAMDWPNWEIFWTDERAVAPDHPDSNFLLVQSLLLSDLDVGNVWRMPGEEPDQKAAADIYARTLRSRLGPDFPVFDMVLLVMEADGHIASLFPSHSALASAALVEAVEVPVELPRRLTLTLPVINAARNVVIMVTGEEKAELVNDILMKNDSQTPAARVMPEDGSCVWILDHEAAKLIR